MVASGCRPYTNRHASNMKTPFPVKPSLSGRIPLVLLWLFGVPLPIIIIILLFRGCS